MIFLSLPGADVGILIGGGGEGANITQCADIVLQLITSTTSQLNVIVQHIPLLQLLRLFDFNQLKERGYRLSGCHIAESRCFCKRWTTLRAEPAFRG